MREAAETMCLLERVRATFAHFGIFDQETGEVRPAVRLLVGQPALRVVLPALTTGPVNQSRPGRDGR